MTNEVTATVERTTSASAAEVLLFARDMRRSIRRGRIKVEPCARSPHHRARHGLWLSRNARAAQLLWNASRTLPRVPASLGLFGFCGVADTPDAVARIVTDQECTISGHRH